MPNKQDSSTHYINANRRGFMQRTAIVGAIASTGTLSTTAQASTDDATVGANASEHAGYRLTDKVKEYYRKARF